MKLALRVAFDHTPAVGKELPAKARAVQRATLDAVLADAAANSPVAPGPPAPGRLRASWTGGPDHIDEAHGTAIEGGTAVPYAVYVELGARGRPGRFMLTRAVERQRGAYARAMAEALRP